MSTNPINNERTLQQPIHSGYGPRTTAQEVIGDLDLSGQTAIVTGGYSGLGLEVSRVLAAAGARVIIPARSKEKAAAAEAAVPGAELESLDLADAESIHAFASRFVASGRPLHLLINCAGIMAIPEQRDSRGFELQFATNHLGHFQLTAELWPALARAKNARVVSVSSGAHKFSPVHFDDIQYHFRSYQKWEAYGQSKTANALFALELDQRGKAHGVRAFSVHPGSIVTDLSRHLSDEEMRGMGALNEQGRRAYTETNDERKTVPEGAATIIWCAVSKQLDGMGGVYCQNVDVAQFVQEDDQSQAGGSGVSPWAADLLSAARLWSVSEELVGIRFAV